MIEGLYPQHYANYEAGLEYLTKEAKFNPCAAYITLSLLQARYGYYEECLKSLRKGIWGEQAKSTGISEVPLNIFLNECNEFLHFQSVKRMRGVLKRLKFREIDVSEEESILNTILSYH